MDSLEDKELLHRLSVSIILVLMSYGAAFAGFVIEKDTQKVSIEIPTPCHKVSKIDGNKIYLKSSGKQCIQVLSRTYIDLNKEIINVYTYIDDTMWKEQKVMPVEDSAMTAKTDIEKFMLKPEGLERVRQFESLKRQEHIDDAKKYEHLKDNVNIDKVRDVALPQNKEQTTKIDITALKSEKQKYIFYLFSKSIPDIAVESVFMQSKKLDINFYGVLRGIDRDRFVLEKVKGIKGFEDITVKVNPLIFKAVGAEVVPAIVYAYCPPPAMFRSSDCDYKYVVYGDISLLGAFEVMGKHDSEAQRLYEELLNAF